MKPIFCIHFFCIIHLLFVSFVEDMTEKRQLAVLASFQKVCLRAKHQKNELVSLGSTLGAKSQASLLQEKTNGLEKTRNCWKTGCALWFLYVEVLLQSAKLLYFLGTKKVSTIQLSWKSMMKLYATTFQSV